MTHAQVAANPFRFSIHSCGTSFYPSPGFRQGVISMTFVLYDIRTISAKKGRLPLQPASQLVHQSNELSTLFFIQ